MRRLRLDADPTAALSLAIVAFDAPAFVDAVLPRRRVRPLDRGAAPEPDARDFLAMYLPLFEIVRQRRVTNPC